MKEPLGDILIYVLGIVFISVWVLGWLILIVRAFFKSILPKDELKIEKFIQFTFKLIGIIQKYSLWGLLILLAIQILASWMGWTDSTTNGITDE